MYRVSHIQRYAKRVYVSRESVGLAGGAAILCEFMCSEVRERVITLSRRILCGWIFPGHLIRARPAACDGKKWAVNLSVLGRLECGGSERKEREVVEVCEKLWLLNFNWSGKLAWWVTVRSCIGAIGKLFFNLLPGNSFSVVERILN